MLCELPRSASLRMRGGHLIEDRTLRLGQRRGGPWLDPRVDGGRVEIRRPQPFDACRDLVQELRLGRSLVECGNKDIRKLGGDLRRRAAAMKQRKDGFFCQNAKK